MNARVVPPSFVLTVLGDALKKARVESAAATEAAAGAAPGEQGAMAAGQAINRGTARHSASVSTRRSNISPIVGSPLTAVRSGRYAWMR
jgi:hypothetical protein